MVLVIVAIAVESDGLINVNPGAYVSLAGAVLILVSPDADGCGSFAT